MNEETVPRNANGHAALSPNELERVLGLPESACPNCMETARRAARREAELVARFARRHHDFGPALRVVILCLMLLATGLLLAAAAAHAADLPTMPAGGNAAQGVPVRLSARDYTNYQIQQLLVGQESTRGRLGEAEVRIQRASEDITLMRSQLAIHDHELARNEGFGAGFMFLMAVLQFFSMRGQRGQRH